MSVFPPPDVRYVIKLAYTFYAPWIWLGPRLICIKLREFEFTFNHRGQEDAMQVWQCPRVCRTHTIRSLELMIGSYVHFRFTSAVLRGKSWEIPLPPFGQGWWVFIWFLWKWQLNQQFFLDNSMLSRRKMYLLSVCMYFSWQVMSFWHFANCILPNF